MIFLDYAATSPLDQRVMPILERGFCQPQNPSSVHRHGQKARAALESARETAAQLLGVARRHVVFTSSATESNNLVIRGLAARSQRLHAPLTVLRSDLEHACIRETTSRLATARVLSLQMLPVLPTGEVDLASAPMAPAQLLCLMAVQNETGVIQPLAEARAFARDRALLWLCDATQAVGLLDMSHGAVGWDFLTCTSHKLGGPPGVGLLAGPGLEQLDPVVTGGPQEDERRAGTQPVALIEAFVEALRLAVEERAARRAHLAALESAFLERLTELAVPFERNGAPCLPGFLNIGIAPHTGVDLVIALDARRISVSSGSACATGVMEPSPALLAMYPGDEDRARRALRLTPGMGTSTEDMIRVADALAGVARSKNQG